MDLKSKACGKKLCMRAQKEVPSAQQEVKFSILIPCGKVCDISKGDGKVEFRLRNKDCIAHLRNVDGALSPFFCEILTIFHSNRDGRDRRKGRRRRSNTSKQTAHAPTSYSLTLHWHQMRMASICGDIIFMPEPEGRVMPSSRATPACVAMPPRFEFLQRIRSIEDWNARKCMHGPNCIAEVSEKMGRRLREPVSLSREIRYARSHSITHTFGSKDEVENGTPI